MDKKLTMRPGEWNVGLHLRDENGLNILKTTLTVMGNENET